MKQLRDNLFLQFSVASLVVMGTIAVVLAVIVSNRIRSDAIEDLVDEAIGSSSGRLLSTLAPADLSVPMVGPRYDEFHNFVQESIVSDRTARIKLWSKDGTVIYSSDPAGVGERFPGKQNLLIALAGENAVEVKLPDDVDNEHERHLGTVIEVYTPIIFSGSSEAEGVLEIYQYYLPTAQRVDSLRRWVFGSIALGFLVLYGTLVSIVWGASKTIRNQRTRLESFNTRLEQQVQERTADLEREAKEREVLAEIGRVINASIHVQDVYQQFADQVRHVVTWDRIAINLIDEEADEFRIVYVAGLHVAGAEIGAVKPLEGSLTARAVAKRPGILLDLENIVKCGGAPGAVAMFKAGIRSVLRVPLLAGGTTIGTLGIGSRQSNAYDDKDLRLAERIGGQIAGAIANSQLNQSLRASQAQYQDLYENAPDMYVSVDPRTAAIIRCNQTCVTALGYTKDEFIGRSIYEIHHPDCLEDVKKAFQSFVETGEVRDAQLQVRRKDGTKIDVSLNVSAVRDDEGNILYSRGSWRDITERKQAEQALRESNLRLEGALEELQQTQTTAIQQGRLRALGTLSSGIAHDFNNALAPILGFSELLLHRPETLKDKTKTNQYLELISTAAQDAANVVSRLREFYRGPDADEGFVPVNLKDLAAQAVSLTRVKWKDEAQAHSISIEMKADLRDVPPIMGSPSELREMLCNLILNAVDAMPHGGTITLRTRNKGVDQVTLEVQDTGIGMSDEVRKRCLDPFFTTKGKRGTGMGLAMVYGTVQRHDGTLDIESEQGQGTTLTITLPIVSDLPKGRTKEKAEAAPRRLLRILVVDDEPTVLLATSEILSGDGHQVETATNGREALDRFIAEPCDLVVTDSAMPEMSGDQLAAAIKTVAPRPVILLTGFGDIMRVTGEKPTGVDMILTKPVTVNKLREAVAAVISDWDGPLGATRARRHRSAKTAQRRLT